MENSNRSILLLKYQALGSNSGKWGETVENNLIVGGNIELRL